MTNVESSPCCKRLVTDEVLEALRQYEGRTFSSFAKLCRAIGWKPSNGGEQRKDDRKRLAIFCEIEYAEKGCSLVLKKVY